MCIQYACINYKKTKGTFSWEYQLICLWSTKCTSYRGLLHTVWTLECCSEEEMKPDKLGLWPNTLKFKPLKFNMCRDPLIPWKSKAGKSYMKCCCFSLNKQCYKKKLIPCQQESRPKHCETLSVCYSVWQSWVEAGLKFLTSINMKATKADLTYSGS